MSIDDKYFCPKCGAFWNLELCDECSYTVDEMVELPTKFRKKSYREEVRDVYKTGEKRNRRKK